MAAEIIVAPEAQQDLDEAYAWYEARRVGLGEAFLASVDARIQQIARLPAAGTIVHENYRRAVVRKYPYAIFYEYANETVTVYCVFHRLTRSGEMATAVALTPTSHREGDPGVTAKPWDDVFDRVRCIYRCDWVYQPKPTAAELDAAEARLGCRFPPSYRAFAERFGLGGSLMGLPSMLFLTRPDGVGEDDPDWYSVVGKSELSWSHAEDDFYEEIRERFTLERIRRWVDFAQDESVYAFVFDPTEATPVAGEYRIYSVSREGRVQAVADSFPEWLSWLGGHYRFEYEEEQTDYTPSYPQVMKPGGTGPIPIPFAPHHSRFKDIPAPDDVARWLAVNHGAVVGLALSIRDENQRDAFPILADALEDAGCAHADLLASCRTGDPDIDGRWVLAVLLDGR